MYIDMILCVHTMYRYIGMTATKVGLACILVCGFLARTAQARANGDWSADLDESTMCGKPEPQQSLHCRACLG